MKWGLYRDPFIDAFHQVSVYLAKQFQRRRIFRNQPIRNKNCLWWPCLLMDREQISNLYRGLSIDASYLVSVHLVKWFQRRRFFRNRPMGNKNCMWRPCLLTDRDQIRIRYRGPSIDASYRVSVHLVKRFQRRRIFRNQPIRNKNWLWQPLLTDREEMCNIYRGPLIDASYQVSVHLARRFQRKRVFRNQPIRKYNCLWLPCLLTDRDKCAFF